jgi:hypothetical protein
VRPAAEEEFQGLLSVAGYMDVIRQVLLAQRVQGKLNISLIVFDKQNFDLSIGHTLSPIMVVGVFS